MIEDDIRIGASICTSKSEYVFDPERWESFAEARLTEQISFLLQKERSEKIITDERVEKRIDLYVASPEQFWRIVRIKAEKIARQFMNK